MAAPAIVGLIIAGLRAVGKEGKRVARIARHRLENPKPSKADIEKLEEAAMRGVKSRADRASKARQAEREQFTLKMRDKQDYLAATKILRDAGVKTNASTRATKMIDEATKSFKPN